MMRKRANNRGFTLVEVLAAASVMAIVLTCTVSMLVMALRSGRSETSQVGTDNNAVIAMGDIVAKVKEAKSFSILDSGHRLSVVWPSVIHPTNGWPDYYDRTATPDTANPWMYYLSDKTGVVGVAGTYLWRTRNGTTPLCIRKDVDYLLFEADTDIGGDCMKVTLRTKDRNYDPILWKTTDSKYAAQTNLTERLVYLRNY